VPAGVAMEMHMAKHARDGELQADTTRCHANPNPNHTPPPPPTATHERALELRAHHEVSR
jgi:hypothetical protein